MHAFSTPVQLNYNGSNLVFPTVNWVEPTSTTSLASNHNPSTAGQSVTFTATVTASKGSPTGTVEFTDDNGTFDQTVNVSGGTASFTTSAIAATTGETVYASFSGNNDLSGSSGQLTQVVNAGAATVTVGPSSLTNPTVGVAYSTSVSGSGGATPYTYSISAGSLPNGLSLNASTGAISGTPTAAGAFSFTVQAADKNNVTGTQAYSVTVGAPTITLSPTTLTAATVGASYNHSVTASGGTSTYSYAVTTGGLPAGLQLNSASGAITGTPTAGGSFNFTITATDSSTGTGSPFKGAQAYSLTVNAPTITLSPSTLTAATVGASYNHSVSASGGTSTYSYSVTSGALPAGLSLNASSGAVTGTPTAGGSFNFTITARDSSTGTGPYTGSQAYSLTVNAPTITVSPSTLPAAAVAAAYNQSVSASGGTSTYSYSITSGALPAGLSLSSAGAITGTPTAGGSFNFTVTARDSSTGTGPYTGSQAYSLTVAAPTITVSPSTLPGSAVGSPYSQTVSAAGGTATYSYAVTAGALPGGVQLNASTGALTGTVTGGGTFNFTITATDSSTGTGPYTGSQSYSISMTAPTIPLSPTSLPSMTVGTAVHASISAVNGTRPYTYAVTAGALPAGLSLSSGGSFSGTPTAQGAYSFTVTATDNSTGSGPYTGTQSYSGSVIAAAPTAITPTSLPTMKIGVAASQQLSVTGGSPPFTFAVTAGALPAGMTLSSSGLISGTPTGAGAYSVTITATDSSTGPGAPFSISRTFTGTVGAPSIKLTPTTLPAAVALTAYSQSLSANGGTAPYTFTIASGALPSGLSLSSSGVLSGTPTVTGGYTFSVHATDSSTGTAAPFSGATSYTLNISPPAITVTPATLPDGAQGTAYNQPLSASGGTGPYTYAIATGKLPAGLTLSTAGVISGTPTGTGTATFNVAATDSSTPTAFSGHQSFTLTIDAAPGPHVVQHTAVVALSGHSTAIDLSSSISGPATGVAIITAPSHGAATASGSTVTYTPSTGFSGTDSFSYQAVGPSGASATATVTVTVAAPTAAPVPTVQALTAKTTAGHSVTIDPTQGASGSPFTSVSLTSQPTVGAATVNGLSIVYTAPSGYTGQARFSYVLSNTAGQSQDSSVTVTVDADPSGPVAPNLSQTTTASQPVTVSLTATATGGPFTAANIIDISPSNGGSVQIKSSGSGASLSYAMTYTPAPDFIGTVTVHYTLSNASATSSPATVVFTVNRPDPTTDPRVRGLITAQSEATRQFAETQINNFNRRLEDLHSPGGGRSSMGVNFNFGDYGPGANPLNDPDVRRLYEAEGIDPMTLAVAKSALGSTGMGTGALGLGQTLGSPTTTGGSVLAAGGGAGQAGGGKPTGLPGGLEVWASGTIDLGQRHDTPGQERLKFSTTGVSFGVDAPVGDTLIVGAGAGLGDNTNVIANALGQQDGTRLTGRNYVAALYASWEPAPKFFIDGVFGAGRLNFDTRRMTVASTLEQGSRNGDETFGALTAAWEYRQGHLFISPYGGLQAASASLGAYAETGDPVLALSFNRQTVDMLTGDLGLRGDYVFRFDSGLFVPRLRLEYRHEFDSSGSATFGYANAIGGPAFTAPSAPLDHDTLNLGVGAEWRLSDGLRFSVDYEGSLANKQEDDERIVVKISAPF
jgi:uncharacterized protein YhjY with autotransporter beta-barrel domain